MLTVPDYDFFFTSLSSFSLSLPINLETNLISPLPLSRVTQCSYREVRMGRGFFLTFAVFNSDFSLLFIFWLPLCLLSQDAHRGKTTRERTVWAVPSAQVGCCAPASSAVLLMPPAAKLHSFVALGLWLPQPPVLLMQCECTQAFSDHDRKIPFYFHGNPDTCVPWGVKELLLQQSCEFLLDTWQQVELDCILFFLWNMNGFVKNRRKWTSKGRQKDSALKVSEHNIILLVAFADF